MVYSSDYLNNAPWTKNTHIIDDKTDKVHKTAFSTLKLKIPKMYSDFNYQDKIIQVIQYLSIAEKIDILEIAYERSIVNNVFDPLFFNVYFVLNMIYSYTNITFTDEQKKDVIKIYDLLESNGLIDEIFVRIPYEERKYFIDNIKDFINLRLEQDYSTAGIVNKGINAFNSFTKVLQGKMPDLTEENIQKILSTLPQLTVNSKE